MMPTRRQFLQDLALISLAPLVPAFLSQSAIAASTKPDDRVLVVIQLDGGNDGLNTVIPYADENYARFRNELRIRKDEVLKLDDSVGLHPQMKSAADLFQDGRLAIVQGVGYPNPNRSHFESMAIWHHARVKSDEHDGNGWLGRAAESAPSRERFTADSIYVGSDAVPVALRGRRANAISLQNESDLRLPDALAAPQVEASASLDVAAFVHRTMDRSFDAARQFRASAEGQAASGGEYPETKLGEKLRLVSRLLKLGGMARIFYVSQPGYDTHSAQLFPHAQLLREFSRGLKAFLNDLKTAQLDDRVVVLAFSEFGRRVAENGSSGTDHGVAAPVFLAGRPIHGGINGAHPSLADLDEGDLKTSIDFRKIYATLLDRWLRVDCQKVLYGEFGPLDLIE